MKRQVLAVFVGTCLATALVAAQGAGSAAQGAAQQPQASEQAKDVTVTGCVIQGSGPTVFILDDARTNPQDQNEKSRQYVLVAASEDLSLKTHLNQEVRVTGIAELKTPPTPPAGQRVQEKDLPKFTAKSLTMVADRCTATR
jgi:hypothetical protein